MLVEVGNLDLTVKNLDLTKRKLLNLQFQSHAKTNDLSQAVNAGICLGDGWRQIVKI